MADNLFVVDNRFTPTCVGTTASSSLNAQHFLVHPHVRGDDKTFPAPSRS